MNETTQTCLFDQQDTGIDLRCLSLQDAKCLYKTDDVELSRVPLACNWTEFGQSLPTLCVSDTPFVAVKQFPEHRATACVREYKLLKACNHPGIVTAFGLNHLTDGPYYMYVMEVGECSLHQLLHCTQAQSFPTDSMSSGADGHYSMSHCLQWMTQLSDALAYLHEKKIMHRDVKSSNVLMFNSKRDCKLCDFDCSRCLSTSDSGSNLTPGIGTQLWMAPEMAKVKLTVGEGRRYTVTSDCYSFGVVMCEAIFRKTPHTLLTMPPVVDSVNASQQVSWFVSDDRQKLLSIAASTFDYGRHKQTLDNIKVTLTELLVEDPKKRPVAGIVSARLKKLQQQQPPMASRTPAAPQQSDDSGAFCGSDSTPVSAVSCRSLYVHYEFRLGDVGAQGSVTGTRQFDKHIEKVLNAIGDRTNRLASRGLDDLVYQARHAFKVIAKKTSDAVLLVEHAIADPCDTSAVAIQTYCQTEPGHTEWLAKQFKEDNWAELRGLTVSVWRWADMFETMICQG